MVKERSLVKDGQKYCTECHTWKPLDDFSPDRKRPDGSLLYKPVCKVCHNNYQKSRMQERSRKLKEYQGTPEYLNSDALNELIMLLPDLKKLVEPKVSDEILLQGITVSKTFKVYQGVLDRLSRYISNHEGEKIQDIVSMALIEYIGNH